MPYLAIFSWNLFREVRKKHSPLRNKMCLTQINQLVCLHQCGCSVSQATYTNLLSALGRQKMQCLVVVIALPEQSKQTNFLILSWLKKAIVIMLFKPVKRLRLCNLDDTSQTAGKTTFSMFFSQFFFFNLQQKSGLPWNLFNRPKSSFTAVCMWWIDGWMDSC